MTTAAFEELAEEASEGEMTETQRRGDPCAHCEPLGAKEVGDVLGVQANTVHVWRYRGVLPEPRWIISGQPVWALNDIKGWAIQTNRWPETGDQRHVGRSRAAS